MLNTKGLVMGLPSQIKVHLARHFPVSPQPPGSQPGNDSELWGRGGGPTHYWQENYRAPWKHESLRHFLVITGHAGPFALETLKHLHFHFKFSAM